ncbi:MAG: endo alpha-1,4 polygalactosaminidase [Euryarchaeota archaeon]
MLLKVLTVATLWTIADHGYPFATYYQNVDLERLIEVHPSAVCVDPYSGPGGRPWTPEELNRLRRVGIRPVAYMTLGVVPRYHPDLFQRARDLGLLGPEDPRWKGDLAVRFWDERWQSELERWVRRLHQMGFEGVFVDVIDVWMRDWYVDWFRRETGGSRDELRGLVYRTLVRIADAARALGMDVYVCAGGAVSDRWFRRLAGEHRIKVVVENVIARDDGTLQSEEDFLSAVGELADLSRLTCVYDVEYGLNLKDEEVRRRLTLLFRLTRVREVYVTTLSHDRLGVAVVPVGGDGGRVSWSVPGSRSEDGRGRAEGTDNRAFGSGRSGLGGGAGGSALPAPLVPPVGRRGKLRPAQSVHPRTGRRYNPSSRPACPSPRGGP